MAMFWLRKTDEWANVPLASRGGRGSGPAGSPGGGSSPESAAGPRAPVAPEASLVLPFLLPFVFPFDAEAGAAWALVIPPGLTVFRNGSPVSLGLTALADRDELLVVMEATGVKQRLYFSTEAAPLIEPAPVALTCPRCKDPLISGGPAVCCPTCRAWHHQTDERPCWTYSDFCAACPTQRTALDGRLSWTPEDL
ncbi:MAG: hypothetical protein FJ276_27455 [Planctomycetes bacterium]|nr:hypothetical protein [Planctomycetota bacterium]